MLKSYIFHAILATVLPGDLMQKMIRISIGALYGLVAKAHSMMAICLRLKGRETVLSFKQQEPPTSTVSPRWMSVPDTVLACLDYLAKKNLLPTRSIKLSDDVIEAVNTKIMSRKHLENQGMTGDELFKDSIDYVNKLILEKSKTPTP